MSITIKHNGRELTETTATTIEAAIADLANQGYELADTRTSRDGYMMGKFIRRGEAYWLTIEAATKTAEVANPVATSAAMATQKQIALLKRYGAYPAEGMTKQAASIAIADILHSV